MHMQAFLICIQYNLISLEAAAYIILQNVNLKSIKYCSLLLIAKASSDCSDKPLEQALSERNNCGKQWRLSDTDQIPPDLGLHCLPMSHKKDARLLKHMLIYMIK